MVIIFKGFIVSDDVKANILVCQEKKLSYYLDYIVLYGWCYRTTQMVMSKRFAGRICN